MLLTKSSSGTGLSSRRYTFRRCRRNRSSNSASWSDEWSSPYHQNQSLPSAMSSSSRACSSEAASARRRRSRSPRGRRPAGPTRSGRPGGQSRSRSSRRSRNPGRCVDSRRGRARTGACLRHRDRSQLGMGGQPSIQRPEKRVAVALEMLPGVLAVQDDGQQGLSPAGGREPAAGLGQPADEVVGGGVRRPSRRRRTRSDPTARGRETRTRPTRRRPGRCTGDTSGPAARRVRTDPA